MGKPSELDTALTALLDADNEIALRRVVNTHPALLTDPAIAILQGAVTRALAADKESLAAAFSVRLALLERCREIGIEGAFAEEFGDQPAQAPAGIDPSVLQAFVAAANWTASRRLLDQHPELLTDAADTLLSHVLRDARGAGHSTAAALFETHLALLRRCREVGPDTAFAEMRRRVATFEVAVARIVNGRLTSEKAIVRAAIGPAVSRDSLAAFLSSRSLDAMRGIVEQHADLLTDDADRCLLQLSNEARSVGGHTFARVMEERRVVLRRCREAGITPAFAEAAERRSQLVPKPEPPRGFESADRDLREQGARLSGDRSLTPAYIDAADAVLARLPSDDAFEYRAGLLTDLGVALRRSREGDRLANLRRAIDCLNQALVIYGAESMPLEYAAAQVNLGNVYRDLARNEYGVDLRRAIRCYRRALHVYAGHGAESIVQDGLAIVRINLGLAYLDIPHGKHKRALNQAIEYFTQALAFFTPDQSPHQYANAQHNLAQAYVQFPTGNTEGDLTTAIQCLTEALRFRTAQETPSSYALTHNSLGKAYMALPARTPEERQQNLTHAIESFREALRFRTAAIVPRDCRDTAFHLCWAHCERSEWLEAKTACATAIDAAEALYRSAYLPRSQRDEVHENSSLYNRMVWLCARLKDDPGVAREGLLYSEAGKARLFLDQLRLVDLPSPPHLPRELLEHEGTFLRTLRDIEQALATQPDEELQIRLAEQRKSAQEGLREVWRSLEREHPHAADYVQLRRAESPTWADYEGLATRIGPEAALLEFYLIESEVVAFVLRAGWSSPRMFSLPLPFSRMFHRYLLQYEGEVLQRSISTRTHDWLGLGEQLLAPLETSLAGVTLLYVVPHGHLHLLPIHALTVDGQPLLAKRAVVYVPSAAVLARILERAPVSHGTGRNIVMGFTPSSDETERDLFLGEAKAVAGYLDCEALLDDAARSSVLDAVASAAAVVHLSCHGAFDHDDPLSTSVTLADGPLSAREWMRFRLRAGLVTLSACQSGHGQIGSGDEVAGLARALLYAGASSALLTLWSVNAVTTRDWMIDFYRLLRTAPQGSGVESAFAFQAATLNLRERYPDPYYWAPFILVGRSGGVYS